MSAPQYKPEDDPAFLLFKRAMETTGPKRADGHSFSLRVKKGDAEISFETNPPTQVFRRDNQQQRSVSKVEAENALRGFEEYVGVEETADKIIVRKKKTFPDQTYQDLKKIVTSLGFRWMQQGGGWEAQKR